MQSLPTAWEIVVASEAHARVLASLGAREAPPSLPERYGLTEFRRFDGPG